MPVYHRYAEDLTGTNPDNFVSGELFSLSDRPVRVVVPRHAPFFVESLVIYDNFTNQPLVKNVDYRVPIIVREATLRTGKEIGDAILIENTSVSSQVRLSYQVLGGDYQNNIDNIVQIYESYLNDNRSVDWVTGIYGKPTEFPPGPHPHWLTDIYGFEPLTVQLERIVQAIMLGNTPAFEMLFSAMNNKGATLEEMDLGLPSDKFVTLEGLLSVVNKYNFNRMVLVPSTAVVRNGQDLWIDVDATYVPDDVNYYWSVEHETSTPDDFVMQTGYVNLVNGKGRFVVQTIADPGVEPEEFFRIALRRNSGSGQVVAMTPRLSLRQHGLTAEDTFYNATTTCCVSSSKAAKKPKTMSIMGSLKNASYT